MVIILVFQTNMISLDNLTKVIDSSQLTREFDGSLDYDHEQWIQLRLVCLLWFPLPHVF